jgi:hypothetical protein
MPITPLLAYLIVDSGNHQEVKTFVDKVNDKTESGEIIKLIGSATASDTGKTELSKHSALPREAAKKARETILENRDKEVGLIRQHIGFVKAGLIYP